MKSTMRLSLRAKAIAVAPCLVIVLLSTATAVAPPRGSDMKVDAVVEAPAVLAVRVRHDMCPYCRALDAEMPELMKKSADQSVLWITLDLTDETTQQQAALLAGALGLEAIWTGDLSKIGSVTLIDGKSKDTISFIEAADAKKIRRALARARK